MENTRMIELKSNVKGDLTYVIRSRNIRRNFLPGSKLRVSFEEVQEALCDLGIARMFQNGYLVFTNPQDAIDVGFAEANEVAKNVKDPKEVLDILTGGKNNDIYLLIKNANQPMQDLIIQTAVQNKLYDSNIVKWCKEFFHYDLLSALAKTSD